MLYLAIQSEAFAQSENQSVKEYLEQPHPTEEQGTAEAEQSSLNDQQIEADEESSRSWIDALGFYENDFCHPFCCCIALILY